MKDLKGRAPKFGFDCSDKYVNGYKNSHLGKVDFKYNIDYIALLVIDQLCSGYDMLDVGCGTAGYFRLLKNYKSLHGVDYSKNMLATASDLSEKFNVKSVSWSCTNFEKFKSNKKFDVIRLGVYGSYEPFSYEIIAKVYDMLENGGMAVFSIHPPMTFKEHIKVLLGKEKIKISVKNFKKFLEKFNNFKVVWTIERRDYNLLFFVIKKNE